MAEVDEMKSESPTRLPYAALAALATLALLCLFYFLIYGILVVTAQTVLPAGAHLQTALDNATCGQTITLQAGAIWDGEYVYRKQCPASNPIRLTTSATLEQRRSNLSDLPKTPQMRALGGSANAALRIAAGSSGLIVDGIDFVDNAGRGVVNAHIAGLEGANDITIERCLFRQKETGTNYNRSVMRAAWIEGARIKFKWNYVHLIGYYYPEHVGGQTTYQMDTTAFLTVGGPGPVTLEDNYINVWWNGFFLGGGDTGPQNLARLSNASLTSATFSNTTGITPGLVLRFSLEAQGTLSGGSTKLTRTSGATITSSEVGRTIEVFRPGATHLMRIVAVNGSEITVQPQGSIAPDGSYNFSVYETATVTSVSGSTVNYSASLPVNVDALKQIPQSAAWNYGDQGLINDVSVVRNTFEVDPAFAHDVFVKKGYAPKGAFEIKNVNRFLYEGNSNIGYQANWGVTPRNQNGTAPWTTTSHMWIRNNLFAPTEHLTDETGGRLAVLALQDELHTTTPATDVQIENNFAKNVANMLQMKGGDLWKVSHNTVINDLSLSNAYHVAVVLEGAPATRFEFSDNVVGYSNYGFSCSVDGKLSTCWPGGVFKNNLIVNFANTDTSAMPGKLNPSPLTFPVGLDMRVTTHKGMASDGKDPGVDVDRLLAALGGALPAPTPLPVPSPLPSPSPMSAQQALDMKWPSTEAQRTALWKQLIEVEGWRDCFVYNNRLRCWRPRP